MTLRFRGDQIRWSIPELSAASGVCDGSRNVGYIQKPDAADSPRRLYVTCFIWWNYWFCLVLHFQFFIHVRL